MNAIVPLFLLAPLVVVPFGYRLLEVAAPGSRPPSVALAAVLPAAALLVVSFALAPGLGSAALAVPWLVVTGATALAAGVRRLRDPNRSRIDVALATDAAVAFLAVGAAFAVTDRLGARPFDFSSTIILLTAVHFHYAGFALPLAGALAWRRRERGWLGVGIGAVVIGIPLTALGFFGLPMANWTGAILTAAGGLAIGLATLTIARAMAGRMASILTAVAGLSLLVSMPLAVTYATGTLLGTDWLGMDLMARLHGGLNVLGFAIPMVLAWTLDGVARRPRSGPAGAIDVIAFNAWPFVLGPVAAVVAGVAALAPLPLVLRVLLGIGAVAAALASVSAYVAVVWVFEVGARRRWAWIARAAGSPRRWINITTGFDDSTATLEATVQGTGRVADVFDPSLVHEAALLRARGRFPPAVEPQRIEDLASALEPTSYDVVFLLMSAHEVPRADRLALFELVERLLSSPGRLLLVEHLRDTANTLGFGPGAQHFQTRATWLEASAHAGLRLTSESTLTPFVRGFVFERASDR